MKAGDWINYVVSYVLVFWWLWCAYEKPLDDQVFYYMLMLLVVIRAEARRNRITLGAEHDG